MISLSTHVLDTGRGRPAEGVLVELFHGDERRAEARTNEDGRVPALAEGLEAGTYRIVFHPDSPFLGAVSFEVRLEDGHYHVPLLVSPYGCTTYRGS